jgi:hypothetical protein
MANLNMQVFGLRVRYLAGRCFAATVVSISRQYMPHFCNPEDGPKNGRDQSKIPDAPERNSGIKGPFFQIAALTRSRTSP